MSENTPYQHIPERRQEVPNLIGDFQHPPDVAEQEHSAANNPGQTRENHNQDSILNQQWDEQLQLQPPLRPTNVSTSQTTNNITNTGGVNVENSATRRQVEVTMDEDQGRQPNEDGPTRYPAECDKACDESMSRASKLYTVQLSPAVRRM